MLTKRKLMVILLVITLVSSLSFGFAANHSYEDTNQINDTVQSEEEIAELIVNTSKNLEDEAYSSLTEKLSQEGFHLQHPSKVNQRHSEGFYQEIAKKMGYTYIVAFDEEYENEQQAIERLERILKNEGIPVNFIEANETVAVFEEHTREIHPSQQWHYDMLFLQEAWDIETGSNDVRIAVLDTGVDYTHPGLNNHVNLEFGKNFVEADFQQDPMDRNGHGTHVAGIIGGYGLTAGVMEHVTLIPIKVLDDEGQGVNLWIYDGILHAIEMESDVINISFGSTSHSQLIKSAMDLAEEEGIVVVAATGNDGIEGLQYPAAYPTVLSVGSVNPQGIRSVFSNYGEGLDLMASGEGIYSTVLQGKYQFRTGTSMAAPQVSGIVGLVRSIQPDMSPAEIRALLRQNTSQGESYDVHNYGQGVLNSFEALKTLVPEEIDEIMEDLSVTRRIFGENRYQTAYEIAMDKYEESGADTIILVRGDGPASQPNVVDGLTASGLAGSLNAPIFLTPSNSLHPSVMQGIIDLGATEVIMVGGEMALETSVEDSLQLASISTRRISLEGGNRYSTAAEVAKEMFSLREQENLVDGQDDGQEDGQSQGKTVIIARGDALVDALVAGPIAHREGFPILLVSERVPKATEDFILEENIENIIIIGGSAVVSEDVEDKLKSLASGEIIRLAGDEVYGENRYGTSMMVLNAYGSETPEVTFVNGVSYVDAVAASVLEAPILYTPRDQFSDHSKGVLAVMESFAFIGGSTVLSEEIYQLAMEIISGP